MWGCDAPKELLVMQRKWIVIAAAVIAAWPAGLDAQRTPRPPRPPRAPRAYAYSYSTENRGRIGVIVNTEPDSQTDKIGAKLAAVTPGGPAAKAGLKVGDVITKFNGTSLAGAKAEDEEESGPGAKLVELARKLEPGDTLQIEYRRGSDSKKATLVAEDLGATFRFEMPKIATVMPRMPGMEGWDLACGTPCGSSGSDGSVELRSAPRRQDLVERAEFERLGHAGPAGGGEEAAHAVVHQLARGKDDALGVGLVTGLQLLEQLLARQVRHTHVDDHRVEGVLPHPRQRLFAARGGLPFVAPTREIALQRDPHRGLVVDDQDVQAIGDWDRGRHGGGGAGGARGDGRQLDHEAGTLGRAFPPETPLAPP